MEWEVAFRLLLTGFCILAPTALYVGLVRALERLRDDPFVERVLMQMDEEYDGAGGSSLSTPGFVPMSVATETGETDACPQCGAPNPPYAEFCGACLASLDE
ncbi:zinc ribbon domain-containing protein [Halogeometricum limi]|uniref:Uncharacterized protein n=1 Tax=Halogeometricum limi TaxID=555875 RepID=A0A1I6I487_9EURY|nr:zinc ribbon domain-containing protein [Halogeometricum limi]SFR61547.1 hypothetical protein SAMN04488124_2800 [Halogeometricum limi]